VEDRKYGLPRIEHLRESPAAMRFLSVEPLLENLGEIDLTGISWVIVGGESGPGARPIEKEWVFSIREQCQVARVPFFFKQWGGKRKSLNGRNLEGRTYDEYPQRALISFQRKLSAWRAKSFASSMRKTFSLVQLRHVPA